MRFRTKIFLSWALLTVGLLGGTFVAIRRSVEQSFNRMADDTFVGINRGLQHLYMERVSGMRQACQLVANIPELRALIAEHNYELAPENLSSLRERLDNVNSVVGATFVCALNEAAAPVAINQHAPWRLPAELDGFIQQSPAALALIERTFESPSGGHYGLWVYRGQLYQVAAVPLVFQSQADAAAAHPEGALVIGKQLTDADARELGKSYGCEISFLAEGRVTTSTLPPALQQELIGLCREGDVPPVLRLGEDTYRAASQPLIDPCSGLAVGRTVIQQNRARATEFLWEVSRKLLLTMLGGVAAAAIASFLLSLAITRPVQALVAGVHGVAQGDLDATFKVSGRDELAQLAEAFNDMVSRLRQSRDELQRLLDEARRGAQREHLLHDVAHQINQRLDVQSSLTMFINSVRDLFPDVHLAVFRYEPQSQRLRLLDREEPDPQNVDPMDEWQNNLAAIDDPDTVAQLGRHELVYLPDAELAGLPDHRSGSTSNRSSVCLVPMRTEQRLLGAIAGMRSRPDGFTVDECNFLQSLADHFAIALANAQVHEELRQAYQDLRANQRQIIQTERLRALGQMASGIAHDFNNHLTSVLAFLEIALDQEHLDPELRNCLEMSRESSLAAAEVVKLLRNFYRRDTSEALEPIDLNKLAAATISLTRPRWFDMPRQHGLVVQVREELGDVGLVLGNAAELRDALTNLLFNAVDAMPQGGQITVRTRRAGHGVCLEIEDTGTGMSDEVREHCLDPFYTTKGMQGTGLGLSMVHGIVERHRGRLEIDSEQGRGTTMRVTLARAEASSLAAPAAPRRRQDDRKRILCVDDDIRILKSLEGMLGKLGHDVTTVSSGAEAINRIAAGQYDVVITDLGMPNVDGREVARSTKRLSPHTRVVLFTGWADRLAIEGDLPEGVDRVLGKPITKDQLQKAIQTTATFVAAPAAAGYDEPTVATS